MVRDIVTMGEGTGLEFDKEDVEELVEEHKEELTMEELAELQSEQQKALVEEHSTEEEEEAPPVSSKEITSARCGPSARTSLRGTTQTGL